MQYISSISLWIRTILIFVFLGWMYILLALFLSPKQLHPFAKKACGVLLSAMGQTVHIHGSWPVLKTPRIYVFNHASLLDTLVCIAHIPEYTSSIGKKEQFSIPIWGWILKHWGCIPIDRKNKKRAIAQLQAFQTHFSGDQALLVSPEGTRSTTGKLLTFKKGPFHIAEQCKASIIPIAISGAFTAKNKNSWKLNRGTIHVYIGENIPSTNMEEIRTHTKDIMQSLLKKAESTANMAAD
jgi:1-acyl-sn-glycerol-3-phosphate acyltransferase